MGGLGGAAIWETLAYTNFSGIGGGTDSLIGTTAAGVGLGNGGETVSIAVTADSNFEAEMAGDRKLRTSFSSDDSRAAKSSRSRFALFALASATKGRTTIAINREMINSISGSICLERITALRDGC
jgi:hypothetical protein